MQVNTPRIRYNTYILSQNKQTNKKSLQQHWFSQNKNKARMDITVFFPYLLTSSLPVHLGTWFAFFAMDHTCLIFSLTVTTRPFPAALCAGVNDEIVHTRLSTSSSHWHESSSVLLREEGIRFLQVWVHCKSDVPCIPSGISLQHLSALKPVFPFKCHQHTTGNGRFPTKCLIFVWNIWEGTLAEFFSHLAMMGKNWNFSNYWISRKLPEGWEAAATSYLVIKCNGWVKLQWQKRRLARGFQVSLLWFYAQGLFSRSY